MADVILLFLSAILVVGAFIGFYFFAFHQWDIKKQIAALKKKHELSDINTYLAQLDEMDSQEAIDNLRKEKGLDD